MMMLKELQTQYYKLLQSQKFKAAYLDYSILEKHIANLKILSEIGNSGITVFDLYKKEHVFASYNMEKLFGYKLSNKTVFDMELFNQKIHPEDYIELFKGGVRLLQFMLALKGNENKKDYKLISEYRIKNSEEKYIRIVEQQLMLEEDVKGNVWLALGVMDICPNQDEGPIRQTLINVTSNEIIALKNEHNEKEIGLTKRESQVLKLVGEGMLSKEISEKLSISVHTVNTHRQHILEKLDVDNSMEAVKYASNLGLLR